MNRGLRRVSLTALILAVLCYITLNDLIQGDWTFLSNSLSNLYVFWNESLWPPEWSMLQARTILNAIQVSDSFVRKHISGF